MFAKLQRRQQRVDEHLRAVERRRNDILLGIYQKKQRIYNIKRSMTICKGQEERAKLMRQLTILEQTVETEESAQTSQDNDDAAES